MNARDELAKIIQREYVRAIDRKRPSDAYTAPADAILAAGYSKPRTITTAEELDALPVESVARSAMGNVYVKDCDLADPSAIWWVTAGAVSEFQSNRVALPAVVLWEPQP